MEKDKKNSPKIDDEAAISASILATEASIEAKMRQLTHQVRTEAGVVVEKFSAIQEIIVDVKDAVDVKKHVERSPFKMLAISALVGLFAGGLLRRRSLPAPKGPRPLTSGPGVFSLLAIGILRPVLTDIVREVAHRSITQRKFRDEREYMNGDRNGHTTH